MDYTCENCKSRHTWDCDDGGVMRKCSDFELDESTLSSEEQRLLRIIRQVMSEKPQNKDSICILENNMSDDFIKGLKLGVEIGMKTEKSMNAIKEYEMLLLKDGYSEAEVVKKVSELTGICLQKVNFILILEE